MRRKVEKSDFEWKFIGYGKYLVTYTSPLTNRCWSEVVTDMPLIDATKNEEYPKRKDLEILKRMCKR